MCDTDKEWYVVFRGRKPGIYYSWPACAVQVNRYKGNIHQGYRTYHEAEAAWRAHCMGGFGGHGDNRVDVSPVYDVGSSSQPILTQGPHSLQRLGSQLAEDIGSEEFLLHHSMQRELDIVCSRMERPGPIYTLHEVKVIDGVEYRRYGASLPTDASSRPMVCVGRWGKEHNDEAKEDAAALLLRKLMASTGKKIRDYNHYNVQVLESQLNTTVDEKLELEMEISILNEELRLMRIGGGKSR